MIEKQKTEFEFSSGGIVVKDKTFLLIKVIDLRGAAVWTFPKGKIEKGESVEEAALREVREETGYKCRILKRLDDVRYFYKRDGKLIIKKVYWYLMEAAEKEGEPDSEVEEIKWADADTALNLLQYKSDIAMMKKFGKS